MIVLDSDHLSVFEYPEADRAERLRERLTLSADRDIYTTAVSLEEQMRGWLAAIHRRQDVRLQVTCYSRLVDLVRFYAHWCILPFDDQAAKEFQRLRHKRVRIGTLFARKGEPCKETAQPLYSTGKNAPLPIVRSNCVWAFPIGRRQVSPSCNVGFASADVASLAKVPDVCVLCYNSAEVPDVGMASEMRIRC